MTPIPPHRRDPNRVNRPRGSAKLARIKVRAIRAREQLGNFPSHADEFALQQIRIILDSIVDICEEGE